MQATSIQVMETKLTRPGAIINFNDGTTLLVKPYVPYGPGTFIDGLEHVVLYKKRCLDALAIHNTYSHATEEKGFWSKTNTTQQDLAQYIKTTSKYSEENKNRVNEVI